MFWWIVKIAIAALSGYLASQLMKTGMSLVWNVVLGIVGGFVGNFVLGLVGLNVTNTLGGIIASVIGACLVIYLARIILPKIKK